MALLPIRHILAVLAHEAKVRKPAHRKGGGALMWLLRRRESAHLVRIAPSGASTTQRHHRMLAHGHLSGRRKIHRRDARSEIQTSLVEGPDTATTRTTRGWALLQAASSGIHVLLHLLPEFRDFWLTPLTPS